jgi:hypothetical protein
MNEIDGLIDSLLLKRPAGFRNKDLAEALGVSRARASQLISNRVRWGELAKARKSRRSRYVRGDNYNRWDVGLAFGTVRNGFWQNLVQDYRRLAYLSLSGLGLTNLRTRQQVRMALRGLSYPQRFLIIDLAGVRSISFAATHELFVEVPNRDLLAVEAINADPAAAQTIRRVMRMQR